MEGQGASTLGSGAGEERFPPYTVVMPEPTSEPFSELARVYDAIFAEVEYDEWCDFVLEVLSARGWDPTPDETPVLDLACGTGSSTLPYATRGFRVVGADASGAMLDVARAKLPGVAFHRQGFLDLDLPQRFDLVVCVFDSLNNLTEPRDLELAFSRVFEHLRPGGWFVFDANTRAGLRDLWDDDRFEGEVLGPDGPVRFVWQHRFDAVAQLGHITAHCQVHTDHGLREFVEEHTERGYDPPVLRPMLERVGFGRVEFLEYPDANVPGADSPRVWGLARKR